ncbi:phenylalanine--tRNA ligase subunit beta [Spiroplasma endosymbiont of Labia minor]|uniref:phenylalanine--tRNA ligase subunit beta n=1 Tax=Spiroplasma endosymbiont of Labia minor TaxID=3066305 RepID=UPI0030CE6830
MKLSWNLLNQFVDLQKFTVNDVANKLTLTGIEVEEIVPLFENTNLVVGEIISAISIEAKPEDKLCKVSIGNEILQIICGAPNARAGIKVVVAKLEANLKHINKIIDKRTVAGVDSFGMICSLEEIGIKKNYLSETEQMSIIELPNDAEVGNENPLKYIGADDVSLELSITPNRIDVYSVYGVAKEISSIMNAKFIWDEKKFERKFKTKFDVEIKTTSIIAYTMSEIKNVSTTISNLNLRLWLLASGQQPINNLVDAGNLVMLIYNQPLHVFDADKLSSNKFTLVDNIDEKITTLDGETNEIKKEDIVISNVNPVVIAGVKGLLNSAVSSETKNLLIESAIFDPISIRKTAKRMQIQSESSNRFARGLVGDHLLNAHELYFSILGEANHNAIPSNIAVFKNFENVNPQINFEIKWLNNYLATNFSDEKILDTLKKLNFKIIDKNNSYDVTAPSYRNDIKIREDIAEEIIRVNGFGFIKTELPVVQVKEIKPHSDYFSHANIVRNLLSANGLNEVITYSLVNQKSYSHFDSLIKTKNQYKLSNPATNLHEIVRKSLIPSLYQVINYNLNRKQSNINIFEISKVSIDDDKEIQLLSIALCGKLIVKKFYNENKSDFFVLKGIIENLFLSLNINENKIKWERIENNNQDLHPNKSAYIKIDEEIVGVIGEIHPLKAKQIGIPNSVLICEIILDKLLNNSITKKFFIAPSIYPIQERDIAFMINSNILVNNIVDFVVSLNIKEVKSVELFDVFVNHEFGDRKKSIAINIIFQSDDKTLDSVLIDEYTSTITNEVIKKFKAEIR